MPQPEDTRPITEGTYRDRRAYLADHVFAESPVGETRRPTSLDGTSGST